MQPSLIDVLLAVGPTTGVAGVAIAAVVWLFRGIIARNIFPQLTRPHAYQIIRLIILCAFGLGIAGIVAWAWADRHDEVPKPTPSPTARPSSVPSPIPAPVSPPALPARNAFELEPINGLPGLRGGVPDDWDEHATTDMRDFSPAPGTPAAAAGVLLTVLTSSQDWRGFVHDTQSTYTLKDHYQGDPDGIPIKYDYSARFYYAWAQAEDVKELKPVSLAIRRPSDMHFVLDEYPAFEAYGQQDNYSRLEIVVLPKEDDERRVSVPMHMVICRVSSADRAVVEKYCRPMINRISIVPVAQ